MQSVSIRFRREETRRRLQSKATASGNSMSAYAEELIDEGLRQRDHPLIVFRDGPTGRRAALVSGPDVWEVVGAIVGGDVPESERLERAADLLQIPLGHVDAAMRYYAEFTVEIDDMITANRKAAEREQRLWERRQELTAG